LLSSESKVVTSPPAKVSAGAYGRVYESTGLHECGGLPLAESMIKRVEKPCRIKLEALGREPPRTHQQYARIGNADK
jgi:hypothetical protein